MERAVLPSNDLLRRGNLSSQDRWQAHRVLRADARTAFIRTVDEERPWVLEQLGLKRKNVVSTLTKRQAERHSTRRALVARGYLSFRRRMISPLRPEFHKADVQ